MDVRKMMTHGPLLYVGYDMQVEGYFMYNCQMTVKLIDTVIMK